jgi:hypothetical protein
MSLSKILFSAALGISALALTTANASAGVACVLVVCWHTTDVYTYPSQTSATSFKPLSTASAP